MSGRAAPGAHLAPRVATGACGTGKTYRLQVLARAAAERGYGVVVVDDGRGWSMARAPLMGCAAPWTRVTSARGARMALDKGARLVLVDAAPDESDLPLQAAAEELAAVVAEWPGEAWLVVPEVHRAVRNGRAPSPRLRDLLHRYRHVRAGLLCDTQHFRDLSTEIRDAAGWLYVHGTGSARDWERLAEWGGPELAEAAKRCALLTRTHGPGWHVAVSSAWTAPPYEVRR